MSPLNFFSFKISSVRIKAEKLKKRIFQLWLIFAAWTYRLGESELLIDYCRILLAFQNVKIFENRFIFIGITVILRTAKHGYFDKISYIAKKNYIKFKAVILGVLNLLRIEYTVSISRVGKGDLSFSNARNGGIVDVFVCTTRMVFLTYSMCDKCFRSRRGGFFVIL